MTALCYALVIGVICLCAVRWRRRALPPEVAPAPPAPPPPGEAGEPLRPGARLGSYQLLEPLGSGGMGEVWLGEHVLLARRAALKLVRRDLLEEEEDDPGAVLRRFEREAQATALLDSPHTVKLFDFGLAPDGSPFYAMELLQGLDLETLVRRFGPLPPARAASLVAQVCASLAEAHARGLVHRDIKPANVFVGCYGLSWDFVKVLDFGLVKGAQRLCKSLPDVLSAELCLAGTLDYMAPEQLSSEHPVGPGTDIYALGCLLYWLLTGHSVFPGSSPLAVALDHIGALPRPASCDAPHPIPPALDLLLLRCLAKDPGARPSSQQLREQLLRMPFPEPWTEAQAQAWWQRQEAPAARAAARGPCLPAGGVSEVCP